MRWSPLLIEWNTLKEVSERKDACKLLEGN